MVGEKRKQIIHYVEEIKKLEDEKGILKKKVQTFMRASSDCPKKFVLFLKNICSSSKDPLKSKTFYAKAEVSIQDNVIFELA